MVDDRFTNTLFRCTGIGFYLYVCLSLVACGGGGSSNSSTSSSIPVIDVPIDAPAAATPVYNGNTSIATPDKNNAPSFALGAQRSVDFAGLLPERIFANMDQILRSSDGAFKDSDLVFPHAEGRFNVDGTGWIETSYQNYSSGENGLADFHNSLNDMFSLDLNPVHGNMVLSGTVVVQYLTDEHAPVVHMLISYSNLNISGNGFNDTLTGTMDVTFAGLGVFPGLSNEHVIANLSIQDAGMHTTWLVQNFVVVSTVSLSVNPPTSSVVVSGNFSDATYGMVTISTPIAPLQYLYNIYNLGPFTGGYLRMQGTNSRSAYFGGVDYYFASIAVDETGSGFPTEAQRFSWTDGEPDVTPSTWTNGPVAFANVLKTPLIGTSGVLDGRFSYNPTGGFITFLWSVDLGQPGGNARFDNSQSATPTLTVDQPGDYLIKLTVSDGLTTSIDREVITVPPQSAAPLFAGPIYKSGPNNIIGQIGHAITLDARIDSVTGQNPSYSPIPPGHVWTLVPPVGSTATLDDVHSMHPTFTPDVNGYYTVNVDGAPQTVINVGEPFQFSMPVQFLSGDVADYEPVDLNGDGKIDFVASINPHVQGENSVAIILNTGNGTFAAPQVFNVGVGSGIAVGDLNSDGLNDVAVDDGDHADILMQQPSGIFSTSNSLQLGCGAYANSEIHAPIGIVKIANDTVGSVLFQGNCGDGVHVFRNDGSGHFSNGAIIPNNELWQAGDLTGDGINDIIVTSYSLTDPTQSDLLVYPGAADGTFGAPSSYSLGNNVNIGFTGVGAGPLLIGDANGDNLQDVITHVPNYILVYAQQSQKLQTPPIMLAANTANSDGSYVLADINGDGLNDIVFQSDNHIGIFLQDNTHQFSTQIFYPTEMTLDSLFFGWQGTFVVDINGDGILDLIFPNGKVLLGAHPGQ